MHSRTSEHFFAVPIQNASTGLEILATQKVCQGNGNGVWRSRRDGLRDALLGRVLMRVLRWPRARRLALRLAWLALSSTLLLGLLLGLLLSLRPRNHLGTLSLHLLHVLLWRHAGLLGSFLDLGFHVGLQFLNGGELLRSRFLARLGHWDAARKHATRQLDRNALRLARARARARHATRRGRRWCGHRDGSEDSDNSAKMFRSTMRLRRVFPRYGRDQSDWRTT